MDKTKRVQLAKECLRNLTHQADVTGIVLGRVTTLTKLPCDTLEEVRDALRKFRDQLNKELK